MDFKKKAEELTKYPYSPIMEPTLFENLSRQIEKALKEVYNEGIERSGNYCDAYARYKESKGGANSEVSMIADVICRGIRELKVK